MDDFSPHKHAEVTGWAAARNMEPVFRPAGTRPSRS
jgi:hypothetical protein